MSRIIKYCWFYFVMWATSILPDLRPCKWIRGFLVRPCFRKVGRNFQLAGGTQILFTDRIEIGNDVYIANSCWISGGAGIVFEDEVMFGPFVVAITGDHTFKDGSARYGKGIRAPIKFERGCWVASHAMITRGVTVGAGSLVAANAVVTKNVEPGSIYGGVPAKKIGEVQSLSDNNPNQ